jgi:hypothetical protein
MNRKLFFSKNHRSRLLQNLTINPQVNKVLPVINQNQSHAN